jgi:hypothetical protein
MLQLFPKNITLSQGSTDDRTSDETSEETIKNASF